MSNVISVKFNGPIRFQYNLVLPLVSSFESTFSAEIVDRYLIQTLAPLPVSAYLVSHGLEDLTIPVYMTFMKDIAKRLKKFLVCHGEDGKITTYLDDNLLAQGVLRFEATQQTAAVFNQEKEEIFHDISFSDDLIKRGATWENVSLERGKLVAPTVSVFRPRIV